MPTARLRREDVLAALRGALPEVARRAGRDRLARIADAVVAAAPGRPLDAAFAVALVHAGQRRDRVVRAAEADAQVLRAAVASGRSAQATVDALRRVGGTLADRRALDRWLDAGAVEDRLLLQRFEADQTVEFLCRVVGASSLASVSDAERDELARIADELVADRGVRWPIRAAAVAVLDRAVEAGADGDRRLRLLARDSTDDPFVVDAAVVAWLRRRSAGERRALLGYLLGPPELDAHPDHAFLRARAAAHASRDGAWDGLRAMLDRGDRSEHARMEAIRGLAHSPRPEDVARVLAHGTMAPDDERVAAVGLVTLLEHPETWEGVAEALLRTPSGRVARVVIDRAWTLAWTPGADRSAELATWSTALTRWARGSDADLRRAAVVLARFAQACADAVESAALTALRSWVASHAEGDRWRVTSGPLHALPGPTLLDLMFVVAHEDLDLAAEPLGALDTRQVPARGWQLSLGLRPERAAWRVAHELTHPRHDKRQAHHHTVDGVPGGAWVAWSGRMSEVTATEVPGQRVSSPRTLSWHEHLPLPVNLLVATRHGQAHVRTPDGVVVIRPLGVGARVGAHRRYVALHETRLRLAELPRDEAAVSYDTALGEAGFGVQRLGALLPAGDLISWLGQAGASDVATGRELALLSVGALGTWATGKVRTEVRLRRMRARLPLVIGGWGSRGKSSVERLKAALFHGLGFLTVCKSTGCEAMVLVGIPGADAEEVFLYRPRDKATIVEQHAVLGLAADMGAQVTLWECMALNPAYTGILQRAWMRDDLTTITNTYPDHEDVQGPTGRDVADVIAEIIPDRGQVVTSEHHMTPVLARRAQERGSRFEAVRPPDWELLPSDLVARFPYQEYDRNLALLLRLAERLDVPADVALRTMADHVLTDLGAFKTYGPVEVDGRSTRFINGCSANDRASFLSNWERAQLGRFDSQSGLGTSLFVVFNNRADRLARQAMFARIAALDVSADRLVIIGTNVGPMADAIRASLQDDLVPRLQSIGSGGRGRAALRALFADRLRRRPWTPDEQRAALAAWQGPAGPVREAACAAWKEEVAFLTELEGDDFDIGVAIARFVSILGARVLTVPDSKATGDQIMKTLAAHVPAGANLTLLGAENIKGTGLDFVYRWVSVAKVQGWLEGLEETDVVSGRERLERLAAYDGWGLYDARHAVGVLRDLRDRGRMARLGLAEDGEAALARAEGAVAARTARLVEVDDTAERGASWRRALRDADLVGSMRRRWKADRVYRDLGRHRVGLARASREIKQIVDEEKG